MPISRLHSHLPLPHSPGVHSPQPRRFLWILKVLLVLLFGFLGWTGWYFYRRGFNREWRVYLVNELRKQGVEVSINRMTLDPVRGLIVHGAVIYDSPARRWVLAEFNRATLDLSIPSLIRGEPFLNGIDFRDATIHVPVDSRRKDSPFFTLTEFWAKLYFLPGSFSLRRAEGELEGVRFAASGALLHDGPIEIGAEPPLAGELDWVRQALHEIRSLRWPGDQAPLLRVDFSGLADRPDRLLIECSLSAGQLAWHSAEASSVELKAQFEGHHLVVERATWRDTSGELRVQGTWSFEEREGWFHLESELQPHGFLSVLPEFFPEAHLLRGLAELEFSTTPKLEMEGRIWPGENDFRWRLTGEVSTGRFAFHATAFESASTSFAWEPDRWYARGMHLRHRTGSLFGDALVEPARTRMRLESDLSPEVLTPFFGKEISAYLADWRFTRPPWVTLEAARTGADAPMQIRGEAIIGRCEYRGTQHRSGLVKFRVEQGAIRYEEMRFDGVDE